jgi:hypothetical protein
VHARVLPADVLGRIRQRADVVLEELRGGVHCMWGSQGTITMAVGGEMDGAFRCRWRSLGRR